MLPLTNFLQNPHYSYIQEHLTPSTSICIFPCFFMICQYCQKKQFHDVIPSLVEIVYLATVFAISTETAHQCYCNELFSCFKDSYIGEALERGGSSDLQGYEEIDCHINGEYSIGCRKEGGEIYFPFSFLHKYFEVRYYL